MFSYRNMSLVRQTKKKCFVFLEIFHYDTFKVLTHLSWLHTKNKRVEIFSVIWGIIITFQISIWIHLRPYIYTNDILCSKATYFFTESNVKGLDSHLNIIIAIFFSWENSIVFIDALFVCTQNCNNNLPKAKSMTWSPGHSSEYIDQYV